MSPELENIEIELKQLNEHLQEIHSTIQSDVQDYLFKVIEKLYSKIGGERIILLEDWK